MDLAKIGDKVVCTCNGGPHRIVSGASSVFVDDIPVARIGDMSSCGATITTGADWFEIEDSPAAINGSQTSCGGQVITGLPASIEIMASSAEAAEQIEGDFITSGVAPGFHIVERPMSGRALETKLLGRATKPQARDKFRALNPHLVERAKPGQMALLSDPDNLQCTRADARLRDAAARVDTVLASLSDEDTAFMVENYAAIAALLDYSSAGVGVTTAMVGKHMTTIERTLRSIERLHQRSFAEYGNLNNLDFLSQRRRLFGQLKRAMGPLVRRGIGFSDHPSLRHALSISPRSLTHHWREGGVGDIPGYAIHIEGVATAAKYIKAGGWIGVGLGSAASYDRVQEACTTGREAECSQVKYAEAGKFIGVGGAAASVGASLVASSICTAIGLATAGEGGIVCGLVVVGSAGVIGGAVGGSKGERIGEIIYEGKVQ